ncbi:methyltransferase domain-containing protein [Nonomuraea harbinensis]|uniref:Methyltransferase domain-containing protein n=1 Tax=Nonomuraea harbinensis TaxID=1286938 RepID=A0ABW1BPX7_9ACTN|nr:methyltransferase domain-containing protein [Nonomuraea harbinensis]
MDWQTWHDAYDLPGSWLARRLRAVQERVGAALDACAPGPVKAISLCAGQGRDVLGVLAGHPRRADVRARLVELDPGNAAIARRAAAAAGLDQVEVVTADAARTDCYEGMAPADLVLACGLFGNLTDEDVRRTVGYCARLCATGGTVIWTRHRTPPDLVPLICEWFGERGFELSWLSDPEAGFGVGAHRFTGRPEPLTPGERMFTFGP